MTTFAPLLRHVVQCSLACVTLLAGSASHAVEVTDLKGFEALFGRYAPGGDCRREPLITIDVTGLSFQVSGKTEKVTNPEYAASYGPDSYQGLMQYFFPFRNSAGYPILMTFNAGEQRGHLLIEAHDEGYAGGPKLAPLNAALVKGSPYAKCK